MRIWHKGIDGAHAFYVNGLLRSLFMSMTTIFVPLFIYTQAMHLWGSYQKALYLIVFFFVVQRAIVALIVFPLSKLIENIGFRRSISLSVILLIGYTLALYFAKDNISWLWASAVCGGLQIPLYWISRDSALSMDIEGSKMGTKMGYIIVLENISGLLGPFAGGAIVAIAGYPTLFVTALVVLGLSTVPLWWMPPHSHRNGVSLAGFWYFLTNGRYLHQAVANFGNSMNDYGNGVIWPLILFLQGITDAKLGAVYSIVAVLTILIQYLTGKWFDRLRSKNDYTDEGVYGFTSVAMALSWLGRIFVTGFAQVVSLDIGRQIFGAVYSNFYVDYMHLGGKRMGSIAYWVYMEVIYSIGAVLLFGTMAIGIYYGIWKEITLMTIALWSLATIVIARESNL